jgi:hypothetical protein
MIKKLCFLAILSTVAIYAHGQQIPNSVLDTKKFTVTFTGAQWNAILGSWNAAAKQINDNTTVGVYRSVIQGMPYLTDSIPNQIRKQLGMPPLHQVANKPDSVGKKGN